MGVNSLARSWVAALLWVVIPGLAAADLEAAFAAIDQEDYELARQELEPLAESGDPTAQYNLGVLHQGGLGTKRSRKVAEGWFRKSADQGYTEAAYALGMMHGAGKGALFDPVEAYVWFWVASRKGHEAARKNLYRITRTMSVDQIIQARKLFDQRNADPSD